MDRDIHKSLTAVGRYWEAGFAAIKSAAQAAESAAQAAEQHRTPDEATLAKFGEISTRLLSILGDWRFREAVPSPPVNPKAPWRIGPQVICGRADLEELCRFLIGLKAVKDPIRVNWSEVDKQADEMRALLNGLLAKGLPKSSNIDSSLLTDTERKVLDLISVNGPIIGKTICSTLGCEQSTLTSHIIPSLKRQGFQIEKRPSVGYYLDTE